MHAVFHGGGILPYRPRLSISSEGCFYLVPDTIGQGRFCEHTMGQQERGARLIIKSAGPPQEYLRRIAIPFNRSWTR